MSKTATLYDKTGAAFSFDHEHNGTLYVRPLVKVVMQTKAELVERRKAALAAELAAMGASSSSIQEKSE